MFQTETDTDALPPCAVRCCRSAAQHDHALAQAQLRSSRGSHNRNQKTRAARLDAASKRGEAASRDLARETRS